MDMVHFNHGYRRCCQCHRCGCVIWCAFCPIAHESLQSLSPNSSNVGAVPFRARWLDNIGLVFFFFNLCLFMTNAILLTMRFNLRPGSFRQSFTDQFESLFIPAAVS